MTVAWGGAETVMGITFTEIGQPPHIDYIDSNAFAHEKMAVPVSPETANAVRQVSCGQPLDGVALRIVTDDGRVLPERQVGEIQVQSNLIFNGYDNRPDLTEMAFSDGWYKTGDLGYLAEGELYVCGRKKDLIIVGGKNIYPQDLEEIVEKVPGVRGGRVVAFGIFNPTAGTEDIYVIAETFSAEANELRRVERTIREHLSREADVTARRVILKESGWLIKSTSGKKARAANREKYLAELP